MVSVGCGNDDGEMTWLWCRDEVASNDDIYNDRQNDILIIFIIKIGDFYSTY